MARTSKLRLFLNGPPAQGVKTALFSGPPRFIQQWRTEKVELASGDFGLLRGCDAKFCRTFRRLFFLTAFLIPVFLAAQKAMPMDSTLLPNPKKPDELSILSWNIKMLPRFVLRVRIGPMRRARAIGAALAASDHDIIVFQEAFDARARRILKRALQASHPFRIGPANPTPMRLKTNSGIMIFSKIPLQELGSVDFSECEGVNCYARKGALLVAGSFNGVSFQVLGTHLDAGAPDAVYRSQYGELRALLDSHRQDGIPQIICGDFNTNPDRERFPEMMEIMDAENGPVLNEHAFPEGYFLNDLKRPEKRKDRRNDVDYIFYRGNGRVPQTIQRQVVVYRQDWAKDHCDLSDHYALMVRLRW